MVVESLFFDDLSSVGVVRDGMVMENLVFGGASSTGPAEKVEAFGFEETRGE